MKKPRRKEDARQLTLQSAEMEGLSLHVPSWRQLDLDTRQRVIGVLAEMACSVVSAVKQARSNRET
jgi:hypothetical protein